MRGKLSRREFLGAGVKNSLMVVGGATFSNGQVNLFFENQTSPGTGFSQKDREILRAAIDEIIPPRDGMPAASQAGVIKYLEQLILEVPALREDFRKILRDLTEISREHFQKDFVSLLPEQRVSVLRDLEHPSSQNVFPVLRDSVYEAYYTQPEIWKLIGYEFHATNLHGPQMKSFDESVLAEVLRKPKFYREVE
jgi:hypothetical protein